MTSSFNNTMANVSGDDAGANLEKLDAVKIKFK